MGVRRLHWRGAFSMVYRGVEAEGQEEDLQLSDFSTAGNPLH